MLTGHFHTSRVLHNLKQPQHRWWWQVWVSLWGSCWWWWWWSWWSLSSLWWWWGGETRTMHCSSRQRVLDSWMPCTVVGGPCSSQPRLSVPVFVLKLSPKLWDKIWNRNQSLRLWIMNHIPLWTMSPSTLVFCSRFCPGAFLKAMRQNLIWGSGSYNVMNHIPLWKASVYDSP